MARRVAELLLAELVTFLDEPRLSGAALREVDGDGVAGGLADAGLEGLGDREFVGAVAERHERRVELVAVDGAADLDQSACAEVRSGPVGDDARPCSGRGSQNVRPGRSVPVRLSLTPRFLHRARGSSCGSLAAASC
jgi:hypothetical protein